MKKSLEPAKALLYSDVLHPSRASVSKDELRSKLGELYKANKDAVSVFGFRTQYGGGKSTGFALIYDSPEVMKKFEPHYRLVRYGLAAKIEKASRQQRESLELRSSESELGIFKGEGLMLTWAVLLQASNGKTEPRPSGVRQKQRVGRRIRRSETVKRLLSFLRRCLSELNSEATVLDLKLGGISLPSI